MPNDLAKMLDGVTNDNNFQTEILVVTLDDNLSHPYFENIQINKDNINPIGNAVLETVYTDNVLKYWASYTGIIVVSVRMLDSNKDNTNSEDYFNKKIKAEFTRYQELLKEKNKAKGLNQQTKKDKIVKQVLQNDYYNYSFIGRVSRFKQKGKKYILYLEDLGWKFMQKVPIEFRKAYIAGQYLDDAFQAICEFMGIEFAYSIDDLHEYTFSTDGYSIQKDGKTIEDVPQILKEWANGKKEDEKKDQVYDATGSNTGLDEYNKKNKDNSNTNNNNNNNTNNNNSNNNNNKNNNTNNKQEDKQSVENKKKEFQDEFDEKIRNLFIGNTFYDSDLCNSILNYDNITITPKQNTQSSNMTTNTNNQNNQNNNKDNKNNNNSNSTYEGKDMYGIIETANSRSII